MSKNAKTESIATSPGHAGTPPFTSVDARECYLHFLPLAQAIAADEVEIIRGDVEIMRINVDRGVSAILPHLATLQKKSPETKLGDLQELPSLSLGLLFIAGQIATPASDGEIKTRLQTLRPLRDMTLRQMEIYADLKLVPAERVVAIRSGTGALDSARDAISLAGLFEEYKTVLTNKHPFTTGQLTDLAAAGNWLVQQLNPKGATVAPSERDAESLIRDRFFTLINRRHEALREAGVAVFGLKKLDENVPPLNSRVRATVADVTPPLAVVAAAPAVAAVSKA